MKSSCILLYLTYICVVGPNMLDAPLPQNGFWEIEIQDRTKDQAYAILNIKCNSCHATKKKTDIFTLENMDSRAPDIHEQVFEKRKMPKGRKVKLTEEERETLNVWVLAIIDGRNPAN